MAIALHNSRTGARDYRSQFAAHARVLQQAPGSSVARHVVPGSAVVRRSLSGISICLRRSMTRTQRISPRGPISSAALTVFVLKRQFIQSRFFLCAEVLGRINQFAAGRRRIVVKCDDVVRYSR